MTKDSSPDRNAADEQREANERRCFLRDCAQDGLTGVDGAQLRERPFSVTAGMSLAQAPTQAAAARERVERLFHGGNLPHKG